MRRRIYFLLLCLGYSCFSKCSSAECIPTLLNGTDCLDENSPYNGTAGMCNSTDMNSACLSSSSSTVSSFLQCVGLSEIASENSMEHMRNLKGVIDAALDVYSFMRSSFSQGPILELSGGISVNTEAEQFHDLEFVKLWIHIKLKPLLSTMSRQFLSCLSTKNFSCKTYQAVVKEFSLHFSNMDPVRQRWIYMFFMYPFLGGDGTAGCVSHGENSEDWLIKNFGSFSVMGRFRDFTALNIVFSGLEVLHLLTPEQKAELILHPEIGGLDNGTIPLVFESLLQPPHFNASGPIYGMTTATPFHHANTMGPGPAMMTHHNGFQQMFNGFLTIMKPLGNFVNEFVHLNQQKNITAMKSTTLAQAVINWTLAELAGHFTQNTIARNETKPSQSPTFDYFDITDADDWFQHVVVPVLKRFLPHDQTEIPKNLTAVFYNLFSLNSAVNSDESDPSDVCSVIVDVHSCAIPNAVENLAYALKCISDTTEAFTEGNLRMLLIELSQTLNSFVEQLSKLNFSSVESHFMDVFGQLQSDSFTDENLHDVEYISLWFQIKLKPLLPSVSKDYLSCLSTKNFSCETYQVLIMELSDHISLMDEMRQQSVYTHFIHPFLLQHRYSDSSCISSASSLKWLVENIGKFSMFAPLQHFFDLHSNFSALEALPVLTAKQMAELVVFPDTEPSTKDHIINTVFDHLLESPKERNLKGFLHYLIMFSPESMMSCDFYNTVIRRLDQALPFMPLELQPDMTASINKFMLMAPEDCILGNVGCSVTPGNETRVCAGVNSTELQHYLDSGNATNMLCHFTIEQYACSPLMHFTAEHLVTLLKCKLPSNMTYSKETWKVFLTKVSGVLDEALNILSNMSLHIISLSTMDFLDIVGEIRIDRFDDVQLMDVDFISTWFHGYLRPFLSSASVGFLQCLSTKNFSCETYHHVVKEFSYQFLHMDQMKQEFVTKYFILPFLSQNTSDPACISSTDGSMAWLHSNFGPFSAFVPLKELLTLNQDFAPLEALPLLSEKQMAELVVLPEMGLPPKDLIINTVFDHLLESPKERKLKDFLHYLIMFSRESMISCDSYRIIIRRLDQALPLVPQDLQPEIRASKNELRQTAPGDCILGEFGCQLTSYNETRVCDGVSSTDLQHFLDSGNTTKICHFTIEQYACSSLMHFTAEHLATLLKCKLPSNMTYSKETWKVLLTKVSGVLDEALNILSNMSLHIISPSTSHFLDILGEIRIGRFSDVQLADVDFINKWFKVVLRPFLSSVSVDFLHCLSTRNLTCETYHHVVKEFSYQFPHMDQMKQKVVYRYFILPFLSRQTSDPACIFSTDSSVDWLHRNFGPFSAFAPLEDLLTLNQDFAPLKALALLSAKQMAELVVAPEAGLPPKDVIINTVFDHLHESQNARNLEEFLHYLVMFSRENMIDCDSYIVIDGRLDQALLSVPMELQTIIRDSRNQFLQTPLGGCIPGGCLVTPHNETRVCAGINSTELQHYIDTGNMTNMLCHFTIEQYACSSLMHFTAEHLATLLKCKLPSDMTYSKETWKVFLTKVSGVLDEALNILSNMSFHIISPSASHFLDILEEIRIDRFTDEQLTNVDFISTWFHGYLRPFLSSVSGGFLQCLSTRNFTCETYHHVVKEFSYQFSHMDEMKQELVIKHLILPFLSRNTSDPACISSTDGGVNWLQMNFGPFSAFVPLKQLQTLNQDFVPLEALPVLSAKQMAELVVLPQTEPPENDLVINTVFDHLLESPKERNLKDFLNYLIMFTAEADVSCDFYKTIVHRLTQALSTVPTELVLTITSSSEALLGMAPQDCMKDVFSGECDVTPVNETKICAGVNSAVLQSKIRDGSITGMLCSFSTEEYACVSPIGLTAQHLVTLLKCKLNSNVTSSKETWKLFITKVSGILDEALELFSNMMASSDNPSTAHVLDVIGEIRIDSFSTADLRSISFVNQWFQMKLKPFLPSVSKEFLSCLSTKNFSCETYQAVLKTLNHHYSEMDSHRQMLVYSEFVDIFLSQKDTADPGCISSTHGTADWLERNFGSFAAFASFTDLQRLNKDFSATDAYGHFTTNQLAEVASIPGHLKNGEDVKGLMNHVNASSLDLFFDMVSPAVQDHESMFPVSVRSEMLQQVFDRGGLAEPSVSDADVQVWLTKRLRPLLANLSEAHVAPYFSIVKERHCITSQEAVEQLDSVHSTLHSDTQTEIYNHILSSLKGPDPLRCYKSGSYYSFLTSSFLSFQFPDLSTFLSLMPLSQKSELINSIPPPDLSELFRRPKVVDNNEELCTIFENYGNTSNFLETQEDVPEGVRGGILPCVWPSALSSDTQEEADLWFEKRLKLYLPFLTKDLISSTETHSAKCLPFSKFVSFLGGSYNYDKADFTREDVYNSIKTYLSTGTKTKCYNATDPQLSSKAWFVNYIGAFITYITLDDLNSFGTAAQLQPFSTNHANLQLFNHSSVPANVSNFFVELIFLEDSNFNPLLLPIHFRCRAPGSAFSQLNGDESMVILHNLTQLCTDLDPEVSAALAGNFETIKSDTIATLGNESVGLTTGQITAAKPSVILLSLSTLSVVTGWNQGQSITIVQSLLKTSFQIINVGHLEQLGSLVAGVPSELISSIDSTGILQTAGNPSFITNIMAAPQIIQQTYVNKIIAVNNQPEMLLENVPDAMATEIPRTLLEFPSNSHERINKKKWKYEQAVLLFETVANGFSEDPDQISSTVLQGFTCTRVQSFTVVRARKLIRACRRKGPNKVVLRETQLTCMYNLIKDFDTSGFQLYPPDLLLYYNYDVVKTQCRTYFTEIGAANFDIISEALKDKKAILLDNAKTCLGITGTAISSENVEVLGNMCCTLDGSYIENSNPLILEKLKNCKDLSTGQIKSVEKLLFTGTTVYGSTTTWDAQTLNSLGILPLYMTTDFWGHFKKAEKIKFLKSFMRTLRKNKTEKRKLKKLFKECNKFFRSKRAAESNCTSGIITQVEISSEAFPFGYTDTQFRICLTATTVKDNLAALAEKVDDDAFQEIILEKLNEVYPAGIPDEQVQVLGSVSRAASIDDINKWNITKIDTLAALMVADDGEWEPDKSETIITKYLSTAGNSLGTAELNSVGGTNLCSLEASVLKGITPDSLKNANALTISNCSIEKKRELFSVAKLAFSNRNTVSLDVYQLIESYLGGAPESYIKTLAASNVNMDMSTFTSLDPDVVNALSVNDVKLLLGSNLPDLKTFENQTIVQDWIKRQLQSELNGLGLNITGGRADPTPTGIGVISTTATGAVTTPIATTTGHGGPSTKSAHGLHLLLLAVVLTALHILQ